MAAQDSTPVANKAAKGGDHDRVTMLSLRADGTPDQVNPEIIGDKDAAIAATTEQFKQQAVSAADREIRGVSSADGEVSTKEDPTVEELQKAHEAAAKGADAAAKSVVESLHKG
jgi:hypothetical protein